MPERIFTADELGLADLACEVASVVIPGSSPPGIVEGLRREMGPFELVAGDLERGFQLSTLVHGVFDDVKAFANGKTALSVCLQLSEHLRALRAFKSVNVITGDRPKADLGTIIFPHLVSVYFGSTEIFDLGTITGADPIPRVMTIPPELAQIVLWELMPPSHLDYLGVELHHVEHWAGRLDDLLALRRLLVEDAASPELTEALGDGYLSFRFVCRHDALITRVLDERLKASE